MGGYIAGFCFNDKEGKAAGIEAPTTWQALLSPQFRNRIAMAHPASSGLGYLMVAGWLQSLGEERGWAFMDALHQNIAVYLHSGVAACAQTAHGERLIGLGADTLASVEIGNGAPVRFIVPTDIVLWDQDSGAVLKGAANPDQAHDLIDWLTTREANDVYAQFFWAVARPEFTPVPPNRPAASIGQLSPMDPSWMVANRDRVIAEWDRRYGSKAAPKP
jgi:iron(III) transport system substrate-binding protein